MAKLFLLYWIIQTWKTKLKSHPWDVNRLPMWKIISLYTARKLVCSVTSFSVSFPKKYLSMNGIHVDDDGMYTTYSCVWLCTIHHEAKFYIVFLWHTSFITFTFSLPPINELCNNWVILWCIVCFGGVLKVLYLYIYVRRIHVYIDEWDKTCCFFELLIRLKKRYIEPTRSNSIINRI